MTELWSDVIATLDGWDQPDHEHSDLRYCPDGSEHEMKVLGIRATCERCGVRVTGWRACRDCARPFKPASGHHHTCPDCYRWEPPATEKQLTYITILADLLGVRPPRCRTLVEAKRAIDELVLLCDADPNLAECETDGCELIVDTRRGPLCWRHRPKRDAR